MVHVRSGSCTSSGKRGATGFFFYGYLIQILRKIKVTHCVCTGVVTCLLSRRSVILISSASHYTSVRTTRIRFLRLVRRASLVGTRHFVMTIITSVTNTGRAGAGCAFLGRLKTFRTMSTAHKKRVGEIKKKNQSRAKCSRRR